MGSACADRLAYLRVTQLFGALALLWAKLPLQRDRLLVEAMAPCWAALAASLDN